MDLSIIEAPECRLREPIKLIDPLPSSLPWIRCCMCSSLRPLPQICSHNLVLRATCTPHEHDIEEEVVRAAPKTSTNFQSAYSTWVCTVTSWPWTNHPDRNPEKSSHVELTNPWRTSNCETSGSQICTTAPPGWFLWSVSMPYFRRDLIRIKRNSKGLVVICHKM